MSKSQKSKTTSAHQPKKTGEAAGSESHAQNNGASAGAGAGAGPQAADPADQFGGKTVAGVFGEVVWLLSQSPRHKHLTLADLEWLAMPPILLRQFKLFYAGQAPVALELYAKVTPEIAARIDAGDKKLKPEEWNCGTEMRLVERVKLGGALASSN